MQFRASTNMKTASGMWPPLATSQLSQTRLQLQVPFFSVVLICNPKFNSINWTFPDGLYVTSTSEFNLIWAAANVVSGAPLPNNMADACELIGLMDNRLLIHPSVSASCNHIDLARHKALYLCSTSLPSTSTDLRGRSDIILTEMLQRGRLVVDTLPSNVARCSFPSWTVLKHLSFQIRDHSGEIATLYGHQTLFVIELLRTIDT